ncbi:MAG: SusC/RagA family TonB-linked outer membrane protein [Cytophagales bacterium]|nr:SusC/RagA family TonB-linked outer membrane protein [Cytophagales bacterium]
MSKRTFHAFIVNCLLISAVYASGLHAQDIKSVRDASIRTELKNVTLLHIIKDIEAKTEYIFSFERDDINPDFRFSGKFRNASVADLLLEISRQTDLKFRQVNNTIHISKKISAFKKDKALEIIIDGITITGKVTSSEDDQGLPGVNVIVKGTSQGTVTDIDGNYSLEVQGETSVLVFSSVGYVQEEITVALQKVINISMVPDIKALEEIVVIGYGTAKRSDLTGSLASIRSESFDNHPMNDFAQILQGRAPGVTVTNSSGSPGQTAKIRIRGANSISGGNDPLYVVDGFVMDFEMLNIFDIESIEILKDASATAIYGSRGANGVVMITTRGGSSEYPRVKLSSNIGISQMSERYDLMNPEEYALFINDYYGQPTFSEAEIEQFRNGGGTDWQDAVFQTGLSQNYQASISGGTGKMNYYISGNFIDEKGTLINTERKKYTFRANFKAELNERLSASFNINAVQHNKKNPNLSTGSDKDGPVWNSLIWSPTEPIYEEDGSFNFGDAYGSLARNPYMIAQESLFEDLTQSVTLNGDLKYKITESLAFDAIVGTRKAANETREAVNEFVDVVSSANRSYNDIFNWQLTTLLTYNKTFRDKHALTMLGGYEVYADNRSGFSARSNDLGVASVGYDNLSLGASQQTSSDYSESSLQSYFVRANYNFKSKYFFTGTYRADGASKFRDDNKFGYFPSLALSWVASEEPFIKDMGLFDQLKLRGSWGITGNQALSPYATLSRLKFLGYSYASNTFYPGYGPAVPPNTDLKWEETAQLNVGLDVALFEGGLSLSFDFFKKNTTDLLTEKALPYYSGMDRRASITQNLGEIENTGFEVNVDWIAARNQNLTWDVNFNFSTLRNEVISLGGQERISGGNYAPGLLTRSPFIMIPGEPLGTFWGYKFQGIWSTQEAAQAAEYGSQPGDSKYEDLNDDKVIGPEDFQVIGDANPDFSWGINNQIKYKNFEFNILVQGVHGQDVYNLAYATTASIIGDSRSITLKEASNYWTPENQNTIWPDVKSSTNVDYMISSKWLQDGSYVKIRNISLAYTIPEEVVKIGNLRLSLSGQNLILFTNYKGYDPEVSSTKNSDTDQGLDFGVYPVPRFITFGAALDF